MANNKEKLTFESASARLEEIVKILEQGNSSISNKRRRV